MVISRSNKPVYVLGGGISGITTALALQEAGFNVTIFSDNVPTQSKNETAVPLIPTGYAMASAYPHNLRVEGLEEISLNSQSKFKELLNEKDSGIFNYKIYEVYEQEPQNSPPLKEQRMNFQEFEGSAKSSELKTKFNPPIRPGAEAIWGWRFDSIFCDMPVYLNFLWKRFKNNGGSLESTKVTLHTVQSLPQNATVINCLGLGSLELFEDRSKKNIVRGSQLLIANAPLILNREGQSVAYNYTPIPSVFPRFDGDAEYVHFFSRLDGWILGQTREPGEFDFKTDTWRGEEVKTKMLEIDGLSIPEPILSLNCAILQNWLDEKNLANCKPLFDRPIDEKMLVARSGYRYYRDPEESGVRLEREKIADKTVIHNYGHGGSGITMSWGCSLKVVSLVERESSSNLTTAGA